MNVFGYTGIDSDITKCIPKLRNLFGYKGIDSNIK
jgi:hypothetical protein